MQNMVLSGLRGIGKTVLLESFRPLAQKKGWLWAGTDCSESASVDEATMAIRIITDIALITSNIPISEKLKKGIGFEPVQTRIVTYLDFPFLVSLYEKTPGLTADKMKAVLIFVWKCIEPLKVKGIVFAYDEAQTLSDHADEKQYPLSMLLDLFQYLQKSNVPFMLVLTGLPTLLVRLIETRTYSERLFRVVMLGKLSPEESREAIVKPITSSNHPLKFSTKSIDLVVEQSGGYPYFIQFMCREVYDVFEQQLIKNETLGVPMDAILQKLDNDFFAGRWAKATDREKQLLIVVAGAGVSEFGVKQVVTLSEQAGIKPFSKSQVSQMLSRLIEVSLIYKDRRGTYSFAVPLLEGYIKRITKSTPELIGT